MAGKGRDEDVGASPRAVLLKRLFSEHASFVWRSLRRLDVAPADVDDALHEVFLVVFGRITEYEHRGLMRAWLFKITRQVANNYHRGNKRNEIRSGTDVEGERLDRLEAEEVVRSFLDDLDEMERMVFYLSDIEGMTALEIADALRINSNTVNARLRMARKRFEREIVRRMER